MGGDGLGGDTMKGKVNRKGIWGGIAVKKESTGSSG